MKLIAVIKWKPSARICDRREMLERVRNEVDVYPVSPSEWVIRRAR